MVRKVRNTITSLAIAGGSLLLAPALSAQQVQQVQQAQVHPKHHSVLKGAAVGAVGGHMTHHKHGALVGAVIGAEVQHHRNKKAAKPGY
ncbi:MAG: hypothetical protein ACR2MQ_13745 [Gemmatimonadaceae bacterium]